MNTKKQEEENRVKEWGTRQDDEPDSIPPVLWDSLEEAKAAAIEDKTGSTKVVRRKEQTWEVLESP